MSLYINNTFRIKRSDAQQEKMKLLFNAGVFEGYKDILMISAVIGYNKKRFIPIEKTASDGVLMSFFNEKDYNIIDLIAYSHTKQQSIIKSDDKYDIFSAYANGGFPILLKELNLDMDVEELSNEDVRKAQCKYYSLLLSGAFLPIDETVNDDDLFI